MQLENFTFGDSDAEVTVAKILSERDNPNLTAIVSRILQRTDVNLKNIKVSREGTKRYLYNLIRKDLFEHIDQYVLDEEIKSYVKNCVIKRLKVAFVRKKDDSNS
jgi:hypothetical protein